MKKIFTVLVIALLLCGCGSSNDEKTIKVASTAVPHAEILEKAKELLKNDGYNLEITIFNDYIKPIEYVESGDMDCNYFAHVPYLDNYNLENDAHEVAVAKIHSEPLGIYAVNKNKLEDLANGDEIIVPNDSTNETRALLLLQENGIITLPAGTTVDSIVTVKDIVAYKVEGIKITEMEAASIPHASGNSLAFICVNGNYAMEAGITDKGIKFESADSNLMVTYVNVLACKDGNQNNEKIQALASCLKSDEIKQFINDKYHGSVIFYEGE